MKWMFAGAALVAALVSAAGQNALAGPWSREDFLKDAIKGDNSEIKLGQLAARSGGTPAVRDFGRTLVADHRKAKAQASRVADKLGIIPPSRAMLKRSRAVAACAAIAQAKLAKRTFEIAT